MGLRATASAWARAREHSLASSRGRGELRAKCRVKHVELPGRQRGIRFLASSSQSGTQCAVVAGCKHVPNRRGQLIRDDPWRERWIEWSLKLFLDTTTALRPSTAKGTSFALPESDARERRSGVGHALQYDRSRGVGNQLGAQGLVDRTHVRVSNVRVLAHPRTSETAGPASLRAIRNVARFLMCATGIEQQFGIDRTEAPMLSRFATFDDAHGSTVAFVVDKSSNSVADTCELQKFFGCARGEVRLTRRSQSVRANRELSIANRDSRNVDVHSHAELRAP